PICPHLCAAGKDPQAGRRRRVYRRMGRRRGVPELSGVGHLNGSPPGRKRGGHKRLFRPGGQDCPHRVQRLFPRHHHRRDLPRHQRTERKSKPENGQLFAQIFHSRKEGLTVMTINILGSEYTVILATEQAEPRLEGCDGFCDETTKEIVVENYKRGQPGSKGKLEIQEQKNIRHEIVQDRKSTRLNSSHVSISYAVFCLKKKKTNKEKL